MSTIDHSIIHSDHRRWEDDVKMWRLDIEEWQKEQSKFFAALETALGAEIAGLKQHTDSIGQHECALPRQHERFIAQMDRSERANASEIEARMADRHGTEADKHGRLQDVHERLKRFHHRAMGKLAILLQALGRDA